MICVVGDAILVYDTITGEHANKIIKNGKNP